MICTTAVNTTDHNARDFCLSVCYSHIWRPVYLICFTLGRLVLEDTIKRSDDFDAIRASNMFNVNTF